METLQNKEQLIIGTIIGCNSVMKELAKSNGEISKMFESYESNTRHYGLTSLYSNIVGVSLKSLTENFEIVEQSNFIKMNEHNNYLAYFKNVYEFLDGYEIGIQKNLNESLGSLNTNNTIDSFKLNLRKCIEELMSSDDYDKYSANDEVLKIKILAKKPLYVCGFDIMNVIKSDSFRTEIETKFKKSIDDIIAVCFDKSNKQIIFVIEPTTILCYDILSDKFDYYNSVNKENQLVKPEKTFTYENYKAYLTENINNMLVDLYLNESKLDLKYGDNLYNDVKRFAEFNAAKNNSQRITKTGIVKI